MQFNFNASNVPVLENNETLPAGWYNVKIVESKGEQTKDQTGYYLAVTFEILDGTYAGRKVFTNINLQNKNPVAQEIGYKTMSSICHCVGVIQVSDTQQLHGIPLAVRLSVRAAGRGADGKDYDASNEVKGYRKFDPAVPSTSGAVPVANNATSGFQAPPVPHGTAFAPQQAPAQQWQQPVQSPMSAPAYPPQNQPAPGGWTPPVAAPAPQPGYPVAVPQQAEMPWMQPQPAPAQQHAPSHAGFQGQPAPAAPQPTPAVAQVAPPWMQQPAG